MFSKRFSPVIGKGIWFEMESDYDTRRDIARSTYGDMLHDKQRNKQYYNAIKKEVKSFIDNGGKMPYCLDIGTGTGLLSMMAATSGVKKITACEAFLPVAEVAKEIIKRNGLANNITVVPKSSMDATVPEDMPQKADIVVMELFDTELIGEGLLPSMRHAHKYLLNKNATVVPAAATVYIQVLQSNELWRMHQLSPDISDDHTCLKIPSKVRDCKGAPSVFDIQADELSLENITQLTQPTPVLRFLFCNMDNKQKYGNINEETVMDDFKTNQVLKYLSDIVIANSGTAHVILMWWVLQMDKEGTIFLSMAPKWMDKEKIERNEWRDHWMQGVFFLEKPLEVTKGERLSIQTAHDDYAFWFDIKPSERSSLSPNLSSPLCTCGVHTVWSRARFAMVNDTKRRNTFYTLSKKLAKGGCRVGLVVSDGSLLSIIMAKAGFEKIYVLEPEAASRRIIEQVIDTNHLGDRVIIVPKRAEVLTPEDIKEKVDVILGEPFFLSSLVPWHDLYFWYASRKIPQILNNSGDIKIYPKKAYLKALGVELKDLWKIKAPLENVEGFNVQDFDDLIQSCSVDNEENEAEPHAMWEYPSKPLTNIHNLLHFHLEHDVPTEKMEATGLLPFVRKGNCNAVVLWMDFLLDDGVSLSTGLPEGKLCTTQDGYVKNWVKFYKQGVFFVHETRHVDIQNENTKLKYNVTFEPDNGLLTMKFQVTSVVI